MSADAGDDAVTGEASEDASGTASGADDTGATADASHERAQPADDTATPDIASRARPDDDDEGANRGRPDDTAALKAWESLSQEDRQALGGLADANRRDHGAFVADVDRVAAAGQFDDAEAARTVTGAHPYHVSHWAALNAAGIPPREWSSERTAGELIGPDLTDFTNPPLPPPEYS